MLIVKLISNARNYEQIYHVISDVGSLASSDLLAAAVRSVVNFLNDGTCNMASSSVSNQVAAATLSLDLKKEEKVTF